MAGCVSVRSSLQVVVELAPWPHRSCVPDIDRLTHCPRVGAQTGGVSTEARSTAGDLGDRSENNWGWIADIGLAVVGGFGTGFEQRDR